MKIKASLPAAKAATCFRAGMAASDLTCSLMDVVQILREPSLKQAAKDLKTRGAAAFDRARVEALRIRELMPDASGSAGVVARKAQRYAENCRKTKAELDYKSRKDLQEKMTKLGKDIQQMYRDSLDRCGQSVPADKILQTLYPERERK